MVYLLVYTRANILPHASACGITGFKVARSGLWQAIR